MAKELLLAIDVGTQSTRALIFDLQGNLLFKTKIPLPVYNAPKPGWAELEPQRFWESLCQACQRLWATPGVEKDQIAGVAITTQRNVLINLDRQGSPLRPAIHWSDQRRTSGLPNVGGVWGL
ncbi:MAG: carbohydrate kinase, partial [Chloroflexi bacterium]|nr:carbohydrate kinase [Chloroflexota bacterium]